MKKILIFASGSGSNAKNIIEYFQVKSSARVVAVFCNNSKAGVLEKADKLKVPSYIFSKDELNSGKVLQEIQAYQPDLIVLAGFLLKCPDNLIVNYPGRIINIHPALLPKYGGKGMYGMHVHRAVVENKEKETGITIHYVNENYDEGAVIFQKSCVLLSTDTAEVVAEKIHDLEQRYFPMVIDDFIREHL